MKRLGERIAYGINCTFKIVGNLFEELDVEKPVHCILESENAVKLFSSMV